MSKLSRDHFFLQTITNNDKNNIKILLIAHFKTFKIQNAFNVDKLLLKVCLQVASPSQCPSKSPSKFVIVSMVRDT